MWIVVFADSLSLVSLCPRDIAEHIPCLETSVVELVAQTLVSKHVVAVTHLINTSLSSLILYCGFSPSVEVVVVVLVELIAAICQRRRHIACMDYCVGNAYCATYSLTLIPSRSTVGVAAEQIGYEPELICLISAYILDSSLTRHVHSAYSLN